MALVLFGYPLPPTKAIVRALPLLRGLGFVRSQEICRRLGFPPALLVQEVTASQEAALTAALKSYLVVGHLEEALTLDRQRIIRSGSRRGQRLRQGLPVRGQRTRSNAQTARRVRGGSRS